MQLDVRNFAKRFASLSLREKMLTCEKLNEWITDRKFGKRTPISQHNIDQLQILNEWCIENIFSGKIPSDMFK